MELEHFDTLVRDSTDHDMLEEESGREECWQFPAAGYLVGLFGRNCREPQIELVLAGYCCTVALVVWQLGSRRGCMGAGGSGCLLLAGTEGIAEDCVPHWSGLCVVLRCCS